MLPEPEGALSVFVPELPSVASHGEMIEEATDMAKGRLPQGAAQRGRRPRGVSSGPLNRWVIARTGVAEMNRNPSKPRETAAERGRAMNRQLGIETPGLAQLTEALWDSYSADGWGLQQFVAIPDESSAPWHLTWCSRL